MAVLMLQGALTSREAPQQLTLQSRMGRARKRLPSCLQFHEEIQSRDVAHLLMVKGVNQLWIPRRTQWLRQIRLPKYSFQRLTRDTSLPQALTSKVGQGTLRTAIRHLLPLSQLLILGSSRQPPPRSPSCSQLLWRLVLDLQRTFLRRRWHRSSL